MEHIMRNIIYVAVLCLLFLLIGSSSFGNINEIYVSPSNPGADDSVRVGVEGWLINSCWSIDSSNVSMDGHIITLDVWTYDATSIFIYCLQYITEYNFSFNLGLLEEGRYVLKVIEHRDSEFYPFPEIKSRQFSVGTDCCFGSRGNADCSFDEDPDISDITRIIDYLYLSHEALCCPEEADVDGSGGEPDVADITRLIDYLYLSHKVNLSCP